MASSNLVRSGGGPTSVAGGVLLVVGRVLNLGGDPESSSSRVRRSPVRRSYGLALPCRRGAARPTRVS
jgi:hypothetical protein